MQVYLRLQVFKGGASEVEVALFSTSFMRYDKGEEEKYTNLLC